MKRKSGRKHGEVFTNNKVVGYILNEVGYTSDKNLQNVRILEPASGKGAFTKEILIRLFKSSIKYNFPFEDTLIANVLFVEVDLLAYQELVISVDSIIEFLTGKNSNVSSKVCIQTDYLSYEFKTKFNCIVGNPPYIRHELIPEEKKKEYRNKFSTFKYRADLYVPFFEQSLTLLKPSGILSFICSNRWINNQYGSELRNLISSKYNLIRLLNIERSSPFDEDVIAYPCIATIENRPNAGAVFICEVNSKEIDFDNIIFKDTLSPVNSSWQNLFLTYNLNHNALLGIMEQSFEIGIGVATGADKVFIRNKYELDEIEKSRLLPLIKSTDLKNNKLNWGEHFVINPYENEKLCNLDDYPNLKNYLIKHKATLIKRHTAQKAPDKWYKTIDKIKPELQHKAKILLPDLTGNNIIFIDEGKFYPHHNIYYITGADIASLKILASILMSEFVKEQMSQIGIRMNGGLPRFQSQVLKKLKVPNIKFISSADKNELINSYDNQDLNTINKLVEKYCTQQGVYEMEAELTKTIAIPQLNLIAS